MQILLAPMEGLLDAPLRDILTRAGGVDRCVSEFIRVTERVLPERAFRRIMPELNFGGLTPAGVPVRGQLLGSDPACMAGNAVRLAEMGSPGIDLNFGCPAKVVNRHGGGASLLQDPQDVYNVVKAVREAVPSHIVVSAKMRLGFHDDSLAEDNARAIEAGVKLHGCTTHFVTPGMDEGQIIGQAAVPVLDDDTEASLAARVLAEEHRLYPEALRLLASGALRIEGNRVLRR